MNLAADHDSALARNLHLHFTACAAYSHPIRQVAIMGKAISSLWGNAASSYLHDVGKMGRWCELRHAVLAVYDHKTRQDAEQFSRPGGEIPPSELSENRAP